MQAGSDFDKKFISFLGRKDVDPVHLAVNNAIFTAVQEQFGCKIRVLEVGIGEHYFPYLCFKYHAERSNTPLEYNAIDVSQNALAFNKRSRKEGLVAPKLQLCDAGNLEAMQGAFSGRKFDIVFMSAPVVMYDSRYNDFRVSSCNFVHELLKHGDRQSGLHTIRSQFLLLPIYSMGYIFHFIDQESEHFKSFLKDLNKALQDTCSPNLKSDVIVGDQSRLINLGDDESGLTVGLSFQGVIQALLDLQSKIDSRADSNAVGCDVTMFKHQNGPSLRQLQDGIRDIKSMFFDYIQQLSADIKQKIQEQMSNELKDVLDRLGLIREQSKAIVSFFTAVLPEFSSEHGCKLILSFYYPEEFNYIKENFLEFFPGCTFEESKEDSILTIIRPGVKPVFEKGSVILSEIEGEPAPTATGCCSIF